MGIKAFRDYVFVRGKASGDAVVRLISEPLVRGLADAGCTVRCVDPATEGLEYGPDSCIVYHYDDDVAVAAIRRGQGNQAGLVIALGSDIYTYEHYLRLGEFTDMFLMPSDVHTTILSAQMFKPVFTLGEIVDPAATGGRALVWDATRRVSGKPRLLWFGYPESFVKSMASLIPVIARALDEGHIASFGVMTDPARFDIPGPWTIVPYSEKTFRDDVQAYDYALLSHFSLDLHVNTLIKSPNKANAALAAGLVPLATETSNYAETLRATGLEKFLFASPGALYAMLKRIDPVEDFAFVAAQDSIARMAALHSRDHVLRRFDTCLSDYGRVRDSLIIDLTPWQDPRRPLRASLARRAARRLLRMIAD